MGKFPQSETAKTYGSIRNINYEDNIIEGLITPEPVLERKAKLTSYLSTTINSNKFLILDKDFVNFLKKYEVGNFQLWNMKIHFGKEVINKYQLFHLSYPSQEKYIDYANSIFYTANIKDYKWVGKDIIVSSYKDFLEKREQLRNQKLILKCHSLKINFSESSEDSIRITDTPQIVGGSGYYVSQRLKEAIEENGFTGMKFKEITELDNRLEVNY